MLTETVWPLSQNGALCKAPALDYLTVDHEGAHCIADVKRLSAQSSMTERDRQLVSTDMLGDGVALITGG